LQVEQTRNQRFNLGFQGFDHVKNLRISNHTTEYTWQELWWGRQKIHL